MFLLAPGTDEGSADTVEVTFGEMAIVVHLKILVSEPEPYDRRLGIIGILE
jgi:hypothetical protein